jgi:hypothetical protein
VLEFGGSGKRYHNKKQCERRCASNVHVFMPTLPIGRDGKVWDSWSVPHYLPWKSNDGNTVDAKFLADILWVNADEIDSDDQWLARLVKAAT